MAVSPRTATEGTFLTAIAANRRRLFQVETNARLLLDTLPHYRAQGLYKLHAFVVMPDHVHLLLSTRLVEGPTARHIGETRIFSTSFSARSEVDATTS